MPFGLMNLRLTVGRQRAHRARRPAALPPPQRAPAASSRARSTPPWRRRPARSCRSGRGPRPAPPHRRGAGRARADVAGADAGRSSSTTCSAPAPCCGWPRREVARPTTSWPRCTGRALDRRARGAWSDADAALLDEARRLLGPQAAARNGKGAATTDEIRTYGHIVIDEVQDLSPMQLRMAARRSLNGSMTVVGDIAQATGTHAPRDWADVLAHLPDRRPARLTELTVGYRIPAQVMALAARVLRITAPALQPPTSVREGEHPPRDPPRRTRRASARPSPTRSPSLQARVGEGSVAVVVPPSLVGHGRGRARRGRRRLRPGRPHRPRRGRQRRAGPPGEGSRARRRGRRRAGPHRGRGAAGSAGALRRAHPGDQAAGCRARRAAARGAARRRSRAG